MNTITLGNKTVYDPPRDMRDANWFMSHSGANRPGMGQFCLLRSDYDALIANNADGALVNLVMKSGDSASQTVTIPVMVAGARPLQTTVGTSTAKDMVWATVYDRRIKLRSGQRSAYNVQRDGFPTDSSGVPAFYQATLTGSPKREWTWSEVFTDLEVSFNTTNDLPSWKPRNIIFDNIPEAAAFDQLAVMLFYAVGFYPTSGKVSLCIPGTWDAQNASYRDQAKATHLIAGRETARHPKRQPGSYKFAFRAVNLDSDDPYALRAYEKTITNSGGDTAYIQNVPVGEYVAVRKGSAWLNQTELDTLATDLAARIARQQKATLDEMKFAGIWPFYCDGAIRGILWESGPRGATTTIRLNNDRDFSPMDDTRRAVEALANQSVVGLGTTMAASGQGGQRYVWAGDIGTRVHPGKLKTAWAAGASAVTITPVKTWTDATANGEPDVSCKVYADPTTANSGPFRGTVNDILAFIYTDASADPPTGVLVNPPMRCAFPVTLSQSGGTAGNATTVCSFTYNVTFNGVTVASAAAPSSRGTTAFGKRVAGTLGMGWYEGTTFYFYPLNEWMAVYQCTTP